MVRWVVGSILHGVDPLSYFSFKPVLHDWCNKGCGMCYPVCGMVHIKEPLLLIDKSSLCGSSGFPLSLSIKHFSLSLVYWCCYHSLLFFQGTPHRCLQTYSLFLLSPHNQVSFVLLVSHSLRTVSLVSIPTGAYLRLMPISSVSFVDPRLVSLGSIPTPRWPSVYLLVHVHSAWVRSPQVDGQVCTFV